MRNCLHIFLFAESLASLARYPPNIKRKGAWYRSGIGLQACLPPWLDYGLIWVFRGASSHIFSFFYMYCSLKTTCSSPLNEYHILNQLCRTSTPLKTPCSHVKASRASSPHPVTMRMWGLWGQLSESESSPYNKWADISSPFYSFSKK